MNNFAENQKQRRWNDLKTAVGTMVKQGNIGKGRMTLDELLLNVKGGDFASLVCQTQIQTEEDKAFYIAKGYDISLTERELREKFPLDPACVWYSPSISNRSMYFNEKTLAAAPLHLDLILSGIYSNADAFFRIIQEREEDVADNRYWDSIAFLPDAMQMDYFNRLVDKKGTDIPGLYETFFDCYRNSDYGFRGITPQTLNAILASKTAVDNAKTEEALKELPDTVTIYRGGNTASTAFNEAYSWTLDVNVANFFATRRGTGDGYLVQAQVAKEDIIEVLDGRGEQEVFIRPGTAHPIQETRIRGLSFLEDALPAVAPMYRQYAEQMKGLCFAQASSEHGLAHQARVLLLSLIIAEQMDIPLRDRRILATAAIYHDTQRVNDTDDIEHGKASGDYYHSNVPSPDPLVEFLCEYHCRPDEEGYAEIMNDRKLSKSRSRSKLLLDIFKDADGLDRVRFGIRALDVNQLRLPISKELTLAARLFTEQVKELGPQKVARPSLADQIKAAEGKTIPPGGPSHSKEMYR